MIIARLLAFVLVLCPVLPAADSAHLAPIIELATQIDDPTVRTDLLRGMLDGLRGTRTLPAPVGWSVLYGQLKNADGELREIADSLASIFGDATAADSAIQRLQDTHAPSDDRLAALQTLLEARDTRLAAVLPSLFANSALRLPAIRAAAVVASPKAPAAILANYAGWSHAERQAAVATLASRKPYARALLKSLKQEQIPRRDIPAYIARQLNTLLGAEFADFWGQSTRLGSDKTAKLKHYHRLLTPEFLASADSANGRAIFLRSCGACHMLYGEGGSIAPDITGSDRANLDYLLDNVINPSGDVADAYKLVTITLRDGQVLGGNVVAESTAQLTLRTVAGEQVLGKPEIAKREVSSVSMMPEGLFDALSRDELRDLVAYLRTPHPLKTK
ncbi:MAG: putative heme-binding domain-containing protein [Rhodothermales bacterium]|jgi:putative heme-binding domain-containing protein